VDYATHSGTAVPGKDYIEKRGTLMFASKDQTKSFDISIIDNPAQDTNRTIILTLSQPAAGAGLLLPLDSVALTIHDNERPGSIDLGFETHITGGMPTVQADGRILLQTGSTLTRLNEDGALDSTINLDTHNQPISSTLVQPDGKLLIGTAIFRSSTNAYEIFRLAADGSPDPNFIRFVRPTFCGRLWGLQPDGKVLAVFSDQNDCGPSRLWRLNTDGSPDTSFRPHSLGSGWLAQIAVLSSGHILLAGFFNSSAGLVRLNPDGSPDPAFRPQISAWVVYSFALHNDGKIVLVGEIDLASEVAGIPNDLIVRLNPNGSRDTTFQSGARVNNVAMFIPAPDGKTLVSVTADVSSHGGILKVGSDQRTGLARLNVNGSLDLDFEVGAGFISYVNNNTVLAVQPDGRILVSGYFTSVDGVERGGIVRLNSGGNSLRLGPLKYLPAGPTQLEIIARPGHAYLLESSSDLRTWLPVTTRTATGFTLQIGDTAPPAASRRFYRAQLLGPE
jgi:uncharacterized delta-60 repeat protein